MNDNKPFVKTAEWSQSVRKKKLFQLVSYMKTDRYVFLKCANY